MSNISKVSSKDTRTVSGTSIVNFKHIWHFILLLKLLNSNKQMMVGFEKQLFQTINLFLVTVRIILSSGLENFVRLCILRLQKDKLSR